MSLYNQLFGPLDSDYCFIFFVLMIIAFIYLVLSVLGMITYMFSSKKRDAKMFGLFLTNALMMGVIYFTHRTLYTMCLSSLR